MLAVSKEEVAVAPQVSLIFGNVTEEDILLRDELDAFAKRPNIRVHYTLDKVTLLTESIFMSLYACPM